MSGMYGADVAQLRQLASHFDQAAERLNSDRMSVGNAIRIAAWVGPVAVRFRVQWDSEHSVRLAAASTRLRDAALALRRNADDQERTSAVDGSGGLGGGLGSFNPGGWSEPGGEGFARINPNWGRLVDLPGFIDYARELTINGFSPWDAISAAGTALKWADVPGPVGTINEWMDVTSWMSRIQDGSFNGHDGADVASAFLKTVGEGTKNPIPFLLGSTIKLGSEIVRETGKADFSQETRDRVADYAADNPGAVIEEIGKATLKVFTWAF